jgi:hypothetical protein
VATDWEGLRAPYIALGLLLAGWIAYFVIQRRRNATSVTWQGRRIDVRRGSMRWTFHFDEIEAVEIPGYQSVHDLWPPSAVLVDGEGRRHKLPYCHAQAWPWPTWGRDRFRSELEANGVIVRPISASAPKISCPSA